jgi:hypothetical protein
MKSIFIVFKSGKQFGVRHTSVNGSIAFFDTEDEALKFRAVIQHLAEASFSYAGICEEARRRCKVGRYAV